MPNMEDAGAIERYKRQIMEFARRSGQQITRPPQVVAAAAVNNQDAGEANIDVRPDDARETAGDELAPPGEGARGEVPEVQIPFPGESQGDKILNPQAQLAPMVSYQTFLQQNPYEGFLKIQVYAAQQALPISNATVTVKKEMTDGDHVFFQGLTDADGLVSQVILPAPSQELSEQPSQYLPFAGYRVHVTHPRFPPVEIPLTPVFAGVRSIQPVEMTPKLLDTMGAGVTNG